MASLNCSDYNVYIVFLKQEGLTLMAEQLADSQAFVERKGRLCLVSNWVWLVSLLAIAALWTTSYVGQN